MGWDRPSYSRLIKIAEVNYQQIKLYDINWVPLNHASCAPQLMSHNSYVHVRMYYAGMQWFECTTSC